MTTATTKWTIGSRRAGMAHHPQDEGSRGFVGLAEIGSGAQRPRRMIFKIDEADLEASRSSGWGGLNGGW